MVGLGVPFTIIWFKDGPIWYVFPDSGGRYSFTIILGSPFGSVPSNHDFLRLFTCWSETTYSISHVVSPMGRSTGSTLATKKCRQNQTCQWPICWKNGAANKCSKSSVICHTPEKKNCWMISWKYIHCILYVYIIYAHTITVIDVSGWLFLLFLLKHVFSPAIYYLFISFTEVPRVVHRRYHKGCTYGFRGVGVLAVWLGGCRFGPESNKPPDLVGFPTNISIPMIGTEKSVAESVFRKCRNLQPGWWEHHISRNHWKAGKWWTQKCQTGWDRYMWSFPTKVTSLELQGWLETKNCLFINWVDDLKLTGMGNYTPDNQDLDN